MCNTVVPYRTGQYKTGPDSKVKGRTVRDSKVKGRTVKYRAGQYMTVKYRAVHDSTWQDST